MEEDQTAAAVSIIPRLESVAWRLMYNIKLVETFFLCFLSYREIRKDQKLLAVSIRILDYELLS